MRFLSSIKSVRNVVDVVSNQIKRAFFRPIKSKNKTNRDHVFQRLDPIVYFALNSDWLAELFVFVIGRIK